MNHMRTPVTALIACSLLTATGQFNMPYVGQSVWQWHSQFLDDPNSYIDPWEEGSAWAQHERIMRFIGPRTMPDGDVNRMSQGVAGYVGWIQGHPKSDTEFPSNWTPLGPFDSPSHAGYSESKVGTGQIHCIAFDPVYATNHVMYAGSALGGLFKSTDAGAHWVSITDSKMPIAGVTDIVIDPNDGSHLFVATGNVDSPGSSYTAGVWRSFDAGATWHAINGGLMPSDASFIGMHAIEMAPGSSNVMLCATSLGIFRSTNVSALDPANVTWIGPVASTADPDYKSLIYDPTDAQVVLASGGDVRRSLDGGLSWSSMIQDYPGLNLSLPPFDLHPPVRFAVAIEETAPHDLYIQFNLQASTQCYTARFDAIAEVWQLGPNFGSSQPSPPAAWVCVAARPGAGTVGHIAHASTVIYNSMDGGVTITSIDPYWGDVHADTHVLTYSPAGNELWVGHDGGLSVALNPSGTDMAAMNWQTRNNGLAVQTISRMACNPVDATQVLIGNQDDANCLRYSDPMGPAWKWLDGGDGGSVQFSPDGDKAWTFVLNSRDRFKKYQGNFNTVTSYQFVQDYAATCDPAVYGTQCTNACPAYVGICGAWGAAVFPPTGFMPQTGQWYFACADQWLENDINAAPTTGTDFTRISQIQEDVGGTWFGDNCVSQEIAHLAIAPSDQNYRYFTTDRIELPTSESCFPYFNTVLFRSRRDPIGAIYPIAGGQAQYEMVDEMPAGWDADPQDISGLVVDPYDPTHIWLTFSGYNADLKVWESYDEGASWINSDQDQGLPNLPVNDIVYQEGSDWALYLAMDVGVYFKTGGMSEWQPYFESLPNVRVTDLDINYCAGKIRAATYGRGLWESDLAVRPTVERVITASDTWIGQRNFAEDVRIESGVTLTINGTVNLAPETKLIIEAGAKVIVDSGTLHNSCGLFWKGVEVLGNSALPQTPSTNQGLIVLKNGGTIENATVGVKLFGTDANGDPIPGTEGGIVQTSSASVFRNCGRDVWFKPYQNMMGGVEVTNRSKFHETTFSSIDNGAGEAITSRMVYLDGVSGITFHDCDFKFNGLVPETTPWNFPTGIYSQNSKFLMDDCDFTQLNAGVRAMDVTGMKPCYIRNSNFDCVGRGIGLNGVYNAEITGNTFTVHDLAGSWSLDGGLTVFYPSGIYLYGCEGYEVEENTLTGLNSEGNVGLVIAGSVQLPNEFYRNHFTKLYVGSLMQGNNRTIDGISGLNVLCNLYGKEDGSEGCVYNVAATKDNAAIAPFVGTSGDPAGNRFYPECPGGLELDFYHDNESPNGTTYVHHQDDYTTPDCATGAPWVTLQNATTNYIPGDGPGSSCPKDPSVVPSTISLKVVFHGAAEDHAALKAVYDGEVNGGDGEYLLGLIEDGGNPSALIRNALLAASPKVDDKVMLSAIQRDPAMDDAHLAQVLLANSPLTPDVLIGMKESEIGEYYQELVREGQEGEPNWRVLVEGELAGLRATAERARHDYLRRVLLADSLGHPLDSVSLMLNDADLAGRPVEMLGLLLAQHDWTSAGNFLSDAEENGLTSKQAMVYEVVLDVLQEPVEAASIVQAAEADLRDIATDEAADCQIQARNLLEHYLDEAFTEPMYLPKEEKRGGVLAATNGPGSNWTIRANPNPANDRLLVITHAPMRDPVYFAALYDAFGHELDRQRVMPGPAISEFDVGRYAPGLYRVALLGPYQGLVNGLSVTIVH